MQHNDENSSMLFCVSVASSFLLLSSIPSCKYTKICLSIHLLIDHFVMFPVWAILNRAAVNSYVYPFCRHMLLFILCKYLGVEEMSFMISIVYPYKN